MGWRPIGGITVTRIKRVNRVLRFVWVLGVNGIIVRMIFTSLFGEPLNRATLNLSNCVEFFLKTAIPFVGIALDFTEVRFAKWVNVGFLTAAGFFNCEEAVRWWSDPYHGVLLLLGMGLLILAVLTGLIYRVTDNFRYVGC